MVASTFQSIAPTTPTSSSPAYAAMPGAASSSSPRAPVAINTGGGLAATNMGLTLVVNSVTYPKSRTAKSAGTREYGNDGEQYGGVVSDHSGRELGTVAHITSPQARLTASVASTWLINEITRLEQENAFLPGLRTHIDDLEAELKREKSRGDQLDKMNTALQNSSKFDINSLIQERDAYKQQADDLTKKADELDHGQEISSGF
ncbi:hypothetical protein KCU67_g9280, partial [Aureobasidium melanogenum]